MDMMLVGSGMKFLPVQKQRSGMKFLPVQKQRSGIKIMLVGDNNVRAGCGVKFRNYIASVGVPQPLPNVVSKKHLGADQMALAVFSLAAVFITWAADKFGKEWLQEWAKYTIKIWPGKYNAYSSPGSLEVGIKRYGDARLIPTAESKMLQGGIVTSVGFSKNIKVESMMNALYWLMRNQSRLVVGMHVIYSRSKAKNTNIVDEIDEIDEINDMVKEADIVAAVIVRNGVEHILPFKDRILIQIKEKRFKRYHVGTVIAFGTGVNKAGRWMSLPLVIGDKVLFSRTFASEGADLIVIRMSDVHLIY